jgi:hypothetical protein
VIAAPSDRTTKQAIRQPEKKKAETRKVSGACAVGAQL